MTGGYVFQSERDVRDVAALVHERRRAGNVEFVEPMRQSAGGDTRFEFYHSIRVRPGVIVTGTYTRTVTVTASPSVIGRATGVLRLVHRALAPGGPTTPVYNGPLSTAPFAAVPYTVMFQPGNSAYLESVTMTLMIPFTYENGTTAERIVMAESVASIGSDYHRLDLASEAYCYKYGPMSTFALTGEE